MAAIGLTVLEIIAISVPLIAIVVMQIFSSDLDDRMSDEVLKTISQLLIGTGFLFLIGIVATLDGILSLALSPSILLGATGLALGLTFLIFAVLVFPMYLFASSTGRIEQTELPDTDESTDPQEEDLPSKGSEREVETEAEPALDEE